MSRDFAGAFRYFPERNTLPDYGFIRFRREEINQWVENFRKQQPTPHLKLRNRHKAFDIDRLIASAKREVYTAHRGETRP